MMKLNQHLIIQFAVLFCFFAHLDLTLGQRYLTWISRDFSTFRFNFCFEFLTQSWLTQNISWIHQIRLTQLGRAYSQSQLYKNQNKENVICENLRFEWNSKFFIFNWFQLKNSMEKYWCGDMFSKPSGLYTPPVEENDSETKGQLISK